MARCLWLLIHPPFFFFHVFVSSLQLFMLTVGGPTTVIKHQLAHLQSCINEARQPAAGATGYNHPVAPQQDNGTAMNRHLPTPASATSDELLDFRHAVDLLTSSHTVEAC